MRDQPTPQMPDPIRIGRERDISRQGGAIDTWARQGQDVYACVVKSTYIRVPLCCESKPTVDETARSFWENAQPASVNPHEFGLKINRERG